MPIGKIEGLRESSSVSFSSGGSNAGPLLVENYGILAGVGGPAASHWDFVVHPSLTGDTADITILNNGDGLTAPNWAAEYYQYELNGDGNWITVPGGVDGNFPTTVRLPSTSTITSARLRRVDRNTLDRESEEPTLPSQPKTVIPATGPVTITIEMTTYCRIAPCAGYMFKPVIRGTGVLDPSGEEVAKEWNYGDPGSVHQRLTPGVTALNNGSVDANVSYDFVGAHNFRTPNAAGYDVTLSIRLKGDPNTYTGTVNTGEIIDAEAFFNTGSSSQTRTYYVDNRADPSPTNHSQDVLNDAPNRIADNRIRRTLQDVLTAANSSNVNKIMVLFHGDQDHDLSLSGKFQGNLSQVFGSYATNGGVDLPRLSGERLQWISPYPNVDVEEHHFGMFDLEFPQGYDPANPIVGDVPVDCIEMNWNSCFENVGFSGGKINVNVKNNRGLIMTNCASTDFGDHAVADYFPLDTVFLACDFRQEPMAVRYAHTVPWDAKGELIPNTAPPQYAGRWFAQHGPFRCNAIRGWLAFIRCEVFTCNGHSSVNSFQPTLRLIAMGEANGWPCVLSQCVLEGGLLNVSSTAGNAGGDYGNIIISKCVIIVFNANAWTYLAHGGIKIINCVFVVPPIAEANPSTLLRWSDDFNSGGYTTTFGFGRNRRSKSNFWAFPPQMINCTFVDLGGVSGPVTLRVNNNTSEVMKIDNCAFSGNCFQGVVAEIASNLDLSSKWTPNYLGAVVPERGPFDPSYTASTCGIIPEPETGSNAIGTGSKSDLWAVDDLFGRIREDVANTNSRPNTICKGALEVPLAA